jgi:hypothetical protein
MPIPDPLSVPSEDVDLQGKDLGDSDSRLFGVSNELICLFLAASSTPSTATTEGMLSPTTSRPSRGRSGYPYPLPCAFPCPAPPRGTAWLSQ